MDTAQVASLAGGSILADYLTPEQLAAELGIARRTLDRWHVCRQGPPRTTIGRTPYYRRDSVEKWLADRERGFDNPSRRRRA
jgi:predicted DNA-binding transcriptional regulator AlpA